MEDIRAQKIYNPEEFENYMKRMLQETHNTERMIKRAKGGDFFGLGEDYIPANLLLISKSYPLFVKNGEIQVSLNPSVELLSLAETYMTKSRELRNITGDHLQEKLDPRTVNPKLVRSLLEEKFLIEQKYLKFLSAIMTKMKLD